MSKQEILSRLLSAISEDGDDDASERKNTARNTPKALTQGFQTMSCSPKFKPGDIVRWKRLPDQGTLKNKILPLDHDLAVVIEQLEKPILSLKDRAGSPYFNEPLDLALGLFDSDGDFSIFHFDARRFELVDSGSSSEPLVDAAKRLAERHEFQPGMLLTWKPGLKNKKTPDYGEPVIVQQMLDEPIIDPDKESGSAYFREPLDMICGEFVDDSFYLFHMDSRRMMPYQPALSAPKADMAAASPGAASRKKGRKNPDVIA